MTHTLGSGPIEQAFRKKMQALAQGIDEILNGRNQPKENGFILMMFKLGDKPGRCNYISNAERADVVALLREQLRYFEGAPDNVEGKA
jgi:hypothetical protein